MSELTKQSLENDIALQEPDDFLIQEESRNEEMEQNLSALKDARLLQWKEAIEAELQQLIIEAAKIRKCINEAKTKYKKSFYEKKFKKVNTQVLRYVGALQRLGTPILPEGTENGSNTVTTD